MGGRVSGVALQRTRKELEAGGKMQEKEDAGAIDGDRSIARPDKEARSRHY